MAIYYVYSPVTGTLNCCPDLSPCYCDGLNGSGATCDYDPGCPDEGTHPAVYGSGPADIIVGSAAAVHFYASLGVGSVYITHNGTCVDTSDPGYPGMALHMYTGLNGAGSYIGAVFFGHVTNRKAVGYHNTTQYTGASRSVLYDVGTLAGYDEEAGCSTAYHVHTERSGSAITHPTIQCPDTLIASGSWLYKWTI